MQMKKVVYVGDEIYRDIFGRALFYGLQDERVEVESWTSFTALAGEIAAGHLADVYLLTSRVREERMDGAGIARLVGAQGKSGEDRLVMILCPDPESTKVSHPELVVSDIPVLDQYLQSIYAGFYLGSYLTNGRVKYGDWLRRENINVPVTSGPAIEVQGLLLSQIIRDSPGGFFQNPRDFIARYKEEAIKILRPEAKVVLERIFPPLISSREVLI